MQRNRSFVFDRPLAIHLRCTYECHFWHSLVCMLALGMPNATLGRLDCNESIDLHGQDKHRMEKQQMMHRPWPMDKYRFLHGPYDQNQDSPNDATCVSATFCSIQCCLHVTVEKGKRQKLLQAPVVRPCLNLRAHEAF